MRAVLAAVGIGRTIAGRAIVANATLTLTAGEVVALVGPSGCGKTTLLQILGLLDRPDAGSLSLFGEDALAMSHGGRAGLRVERIGFVFQEHNLLGQLSVRENVALPAWKRTGSRAKALERTDRLLERLGLSARADAEPASLSGGESQRVAIARALVNEPGIVLADEPTGSLDSAAAETVLAALLSARDAGAAVLLVTHDRDVAERAGRVVTMTDGVASDGDDAPVSRLPRSHRAPPQ